MRAVPRVGECARSDSDANNDILEDCGRVICHTLNTFAIATACLSHLVMRGV